MAHKDILVYVETENGKAKGVGYELIGVSRPIADKLGCGLKAVLVGNNLKKAAQDAICYGADAAYIIEGDEYAYYSTDAYTEALVAFINKYEPETMMIGATPNGRDMAPRIACRLKTGLTADCTGIDVDPDTSCIGWTRPTFGGNLMATIICPEQRPQMGTVRPGVFQKPAYNKEAKGEIIAEDIHVAADHIRTSLVESIEAAVEAVKLEEAEIIVSVGRGIGSAENIKIAQDLADVIGGTLGCSRPVAEAGWMEHNRQVGQSGKTVAPRIYFALGISGAVQHTAGMSGSQTIIAVNKDPNAPIFNVADFSICGDVNTIVPVLTEAFKKKMAVEEV